MCKLAATYAAEESAAMLPDSPSPIELALWTLS